MGDPFAEVVEYSLTDPNIPELANPHPMCIAPTEYDSYDGGKRTFPKQCGYDEGHLLMDMLDQIEENVGEQVETVTAERGHGTAANYANLEEIGVEAVIPPKIEDEIRDFFFDSWNEVVICKKAASFVTSGLR